MNTGFSEHASSEEYLGRYGTWREKIKRFEKGEKITLLVNTEAIERNCYYFSYLN